MTESVRNQYYVRVVQLYSYRYMYMYEYYCTVHCTVLVLVRYMYRYLYLYGQYLYSYGTCARISSHPWGSITGLTAHQQLDSRPALGNEMTHSENDLRPKIRDFWFLIPQEGVNFALRNAAKCQRIGAKMPKMPRGVQNAEKCLEGSRMPKALPAPNRRPKPVLYYGSIRNTTYTSTAAGQR